MPKIYIYALILIIIVGFIKWYSDRQYDAGYNAYKAELSDKKDTQEEKDKASVETIIKWRTKTKIVYRDKINDIKNTEDITGCLDTKLVDLGVRL